MGFNIMPSILKLNAKSAAYKGGFIIDLSLSNWIPYFFRVVYDMGVLKHFGPKKSCKKN